MNDGVSPQIVFFADQCYEEAKHRLNNLLDALVIDMKTRPQPQTDSLSWAASTLVMMGKLQNPPNPEYAAHAVEVWQAAIYQIARQRLAAERAAELARKHLQGEP